MSPAATAGAVSPAAAAGAGSAAAAAPAPGSAELAERYGTPLYVYDLDRVLAARQALRAALPDRFALFYSFKANPHPDVARALGETGCRAEVSSVGELAAALAAGYDPASTVYTGPGKTAAEIEAALAVGVRTFSVESEPDVERVGALALAHGGRADCLLRVNATGSGASTSIRMTGVPSQFGFDAETLPAALPRLLAVPGTRVIGAHFYPLSNSRDEASLVAEFRRSIEAAAELAAAGLPLLMLDLGGGFAAPYAVPGSRPRYGTLRAELEAALDQHLPSWRDGVPEVACESGRHLVGDCGELVTAVSTVKRGRGRTFVVLDAGINVLGGMAGLGRLMPLAVRPDPDGPPATEVATLVGPLCTPGDVLGRDLDVPALAPGDLVTVPNVGAYGPTASLLGFLSRPAPAEVVLRAGEVVSVSRLRIDRVQVP